jgi:hypothetical protein
MILEIFSPKQLAKNRRFWNMYWHFMQNIDHGMSFQEKRQIVRRKMAENREHKIDSKLVDCVIADCRNKK